MNSAAQIVEELLEDYDPEQVRIGTEIEKEHTDDPDEAERIAKDHLRENPHYYPTGPQPKGKKEALRFV